QYLNTRLLIIDSLSKLFCTDFASPVKLAEREEELKCIFDLLLELAETNGLAIIVTNQVTSSHHGYLEKQVVGGDVVAHSSHRRVILLKGRGKTRAARLVDDPLLPETQIYFQIEEHGISSEKEEECRVFGGNTDNNPVNIELDEELVDIIEKPDIKASKEPLSSVKRC
ncbi:MAG: hypothetical protein ACFFD4_36305, partial [Candidatus Odinarchaeota archaeon]